MALTGGEQRISIVHPTRRLIVSDVPTAGSMQGMLLDLLPAARLRPRCARIGLSVASICDFSPDNDLAVVARTREDAPKLWMSPAHAPYRSIVPSERVEQRMAPAGLVDLEQLHRTV